MSHDRKGSLGVPDPVCETGQRLKMPSCEYSVLKPVFSSDTLTARSKASPSCSAWPVASVHHLHPRLPPLQRCFRPQRPTLPQLAPLFHTKGWNFSSSHPQAVGACNPLPSRVLFPPQGPPH